MSNVVINYPKIEDFILMYDKSMDEFTFVIQTLVEYTQDVYTTAFISGELHDAIGDFKILMSELEPIPAQIKDIVRNVLNQFLDDLDAAQKVNGRSVLYDRAYPDNRDYTSDKFRKLEELVEKANYNTGLFNTVYDFFEDQVGGTLARIFGWRNNAKTDRIDVVQKRLMQECDVTLLELKNIERSIEKADENCNSKLARVNELIDNFSTYINHLANLCIHSECAPPKLDFSDLQLEEYYNKLMLSLNTAISIDVLTDEEVEAFINSEGADNYLEEETDIIKDYIGEVAETMDGKSLDLYLLILFQLFNVAEGQIITGGHYEEMATKKELMEQLDDLSKNYVYSGSDEEEAVETLNDILGEIKKQGGNIYEFLNSHRDKNGALLLDGRTKKAKEFMKFLDSLDNAQYFIDMGSKGVGIISKMFIDYDKNLQFLDSFERNANMSDEMKECYADIRDIYEKELSAYLKEYAQFAAEGGVDLLYECSIGKMVGTVKNSIGLVGEITGENARTGAKLDLMNYGYDVLNSSQSAFLESMNKFKMADKSDPNYDMLMNDFKNCSLMYKNNVRRMFEKAAVAAKPPQKEYFYYCSREISQMSLKELIDPDLMTYEDYIAQR